MYHTITPEVADKIEILLREYEHAAMGTYGKKYPDVTKVTPVCVEGTVYLLLSDLSTHTKNINNISNNVSLFFADRNRHATEMNNARLTLYGTVDKHTCTAEEYTTLLTHFDRRDKGASMYGKFADFNIYKFVEKDRLYIEGFGKAYKPEKENE